MTTIQVWLRFLPFPFPSTIYSILPSPHPPIPPTLSPKLTRPTTPPDYYTRVPRPNQICGFDGAGLVEAVGPDVRTFAPGDAVFFAGSPVRQGSDAEWELVDARSVAAKPERLGWAQAASMPLTWITAWEALVERWVVASFFFGFGGACATWLMVCRLEIRKGEEAALLIINGAGGGFPLFHQSSPPPFFFSFC